MQHSTISFVFILQVKGAHIESQNFFLFAWSRFYCKLLVCDRNYAEVFDEPNSVSEVLTGKICREKAVFSKRNSLYVKYSVILKDRYWRGFWASYEAVDPLRPASYSCSGEASIVASSAGEFASYDYPLIYPNDASCSWQLRVPPTHIVQLTFTSFELQPSPSCGSDYVEVRQGRNIIETELVGKFCGATPPAPFLSNHSMVYVKFVTDSSERYPGFKATFRAIQNRKCLRIRCLFPCDFV